MTLEKKIRADIEFVRVISAFCVVMYHSGVPSAKYWYFGLILFLILSSYFSGIGYGIHQSFKKRFYRLLIPFASGFLIYGTFNLIRGKNFLELKSGILSGVLASPSIHLWYLPYVFSVLVVTDQLKRLIPRPQFVIGSGLISTIFLLTAFLWRNPSVEMGYPWAQYIHSSAAIFFGFFLAGFSDNMCGKWRNVVMFSNLIAAAVYSLCNNCGYEYLVAFVIASGVIVMGVGKMIPETPFISVISQCGLGIYIFHILVFSIVRRIDVIQGSVLFPILSYSLTLGFVLFFRKMFPKLAKMII